MLDKLGVEIFLDTSVGNVGSNGRRPPLVLLCEEYDAVYLGIGADVNDFNDLTLDAQGQIPDRPDHLPDQSGWVFAGGSFLHARDLGSSIAQRVSQFVPEQNPQALRRVAISKPAL